jgi:hypothetical protein
VAEVVEVLKIALDNPIKVIQELLALPWAVLVEMLARKQVVAAEVVEVAKMVAQVEHLARARFLTSRVDLLVKTAIVWHPAVAQYQGVKQPAVAPRTQQVLPAALLLDTIPERLLALCIALINIKR